MANIFGVANPDRRPERRTYDLQQEVRSGRWQDNSSLWTHGYKYGDGHAGLRDHRFLPTQPPATEQRKTGWRAPVDDGPATSTRAGARAAQGRWRRTGRGVAQLQKRGGGRPMTAFEHRFLEAPKNGGLVPHLQQDGVRVCADGQRVCRQPYLTPYASVAPPGSWTAGHSLASSSYRPRHYLEFLVLDPPPRISNVVQQTRRCPRNCRPRCGRHTGIVTFCGPPFRTLPHGRRVIRAVDQDPRVPSLFLHKTAFIFKP